MDTDIKSLCSKILSTKQYIIIVFMLFVLYIVTGLLPEGTQKCAVHLEDYFGCI